MEEVKEGSGDMLGFTLDSLPDEILLQIFEYLHFDELCRCSQVSRKWHYLTHSLCLKMIIICKYVSTEKMILLLKHPLLTEHLQTFRCINRRFVPLGSLVFSLLKYKCPNLKNLVLEKCVLHVASFCDLPVSLSHLSLRLCKINPYWLFGRTDVDIKVTCLDLSGVNDCFTSEDMRYLLCLKNLRCLYLESCNRLNNGGIMWILPLLPQLEVLDIEGTDINNEVVWDILFCGEQLKELYLGHTCIDEHAFRDIQKPQSLRVLCVRETNVSVPAIDQLVSLFGKQTHILSSHKSQSCSLPLFSNSKPQVGCADYKGCCHYLEHICS